METYTEKVGNKLNDLLIRTYDAKKGYENAAENVDNLALKSFFERKSTEREMFTDQLKTVIGTFEQNPTDTDGSVSGTMHRAWMDLKSIVSSNNSEAILEEAIRGEEKAIEDYKEVLNEISLTSEAKEIIDSQLSVIKTSLDTVKTLDDLH
ncbi:ferritin-like domain-containing protein [Aquimarina agarivorans]|uniref:ferritin-like domain-containing protein n=1 Tax=Aquimarina agarivorans TaxID=980584 RepID=UPI000248EA38|nr:PA2169 family four-helix-bundle protein [Aquimarina agarivorans]